MLVIYKMKNGLDYEMNIGPMDEHDFSKEGSFLEAMQNGIKNNAEITLNSVVLKWKDVKSVEFVI